MRESFVVWLRRLGEIPIYPTCSINDVEWAKEFFKKQKARFEFAAMNKKRKLYIASCYSFEEPFCIAQPLDPIRDPDVVYDLRGKALALATVLRLEGLEVSHNTDDPESELLSVEGELRTELKPVHLGTTLRKPLAGAEEIFIIASW